MQSAVCSVSRFFQCLQTLVGCGLSGPTSPLAFAESVLGALRGSADAVHHKEQLLRMWSVMVAPLTDTITQVGDGRCILYFYVFNICYSEIKSDKIPVL